MRDPFAQYWCIDFGLLTRYDLAVGAYASWLLSPNRIMRNHAESCEIMTDHANHNPDSA